MLVTRSVVVFETHCPACFNASHCLAAKPWLSHRHSTTTQLMTAATASFGSTRNDLIYKPGILLPFMSHAALLLQWASHWGQTRMERQGHIMESVACGFLWMWGGFFLSRCYQISCLLHISHCLWHICKDHSCTQHSFHIITALCALLILFAPRSFRQTPVVASMAKHCGAI